MSRGHRRSRDHDAGPWLEPQDAEPRLLLFGPPVLDPALDPAVAAALAAGRPAALIVSPRAFGERDQTVARLERLRALTNQAGAALLIDGDAAAAINGGADGVFVRGSIEIPPARRVLGLGRLIGADCGHSRHEAMTAGEAGADFVAFGELERVPDEGELVDLVAWWGELFVLPVAALAPLRTRTIEQLLRAGADFIGIGGDLWARPDEVADALGTLAGLLTGDGTSARRNS